MGGIDIHQAQQRTQGNCNTSFDAVHDLLDGQDLRTNVQQFWEDRGEPRTRVALDLSAIDASLVGAGAPGANRNPYLQEVTIAPDAPYLAIVSVRQPFVVSATFDSIESVSLDTALRNGKGKVAFLKQVREGGDTALVASGKIV